MSYYTGKSYKYSIEYIWLDGETPSQNIRSKTKVVDIPITECVGRLDFDKIPKWSFDGSSTKQAETSNSDLVLSPVHLVEAPKQLGVDYLVMCEVLNFDGTPHFTNTRKKLEKLLTYEVNKKESWVGFEQEYFLRREDEILGWEHGTPRPQGDYYCGVGAKNVVGREIALEHMNACMEAGININGINAEVALGQWEFQVGGPNVHALQVCDELWISRYILERVSEKYHVTIDYDPKPLIGDWNGSGLHTNFSTKEMRSYAGINYIKEFCKKMGREEMVDLAISNYGDGLERRLTGKHETSSINDFSIGDMNRSCSIRIPIHVKQKGCGYLEDRRPNSNADPYRVLSVLVRNLS